MTCVINKSIKQLSALIEKVNDQEAGQVLERMRQVEQKMSLVYTFLKASRYSHNPNEQEESTTNRPSFQSMEE